MLGYVFEATGLDGITMERFCVLKRRGPSPWLLEERNHPEMLRKGDQEAVREIRGPCV